MAIQDELLAALKTAGLTPYLAGTHRGKCASPYVVVVGNGVYPIGKTVGRRSYRVIGFVPVARPGDLAGMMAAVRSAIASVRPLRAATETSPEYINSEYEAYCAELECSALCAL